MATSEMGDCTGNESRMRYVGQLSGFDPKPTVNYNFVEVTPPYSTSVP